MKILFVCHRNTGRSQMAEGLYNLLTDSDNASSAGTDVVEKNQVVGDRPKAVHVITVMKELNVDVSNSPRNQIVEEDLAKYERIVVMTDLATVSSWLEHAKNVTFWDVPDPVDEDEVGTRESRDHIRIMIENKLL